MGNVFLTDLVVRLRVEIPGINIIEIDGWQTRSNSQGGYDNPQGIVIHHDAAGPPDSASVNFQTFRDADKPNTALHTGRAGELYVCAAGATNAQGAGGGIWGLPVDAAAPYVGNHRVISFEQGNRGTGEPWPTAQQDTTMRVCAALHRIYGDRFGWAGVRVASHFEWRGALGGKNDPAGPCRWNDNQNTRWNMDRFRADVALTMQPIPEPVEPTPLEVAAAIWG